MLTDNLTYSISDDYTMHIDGNGEMYDYYSYRNYNWARIKRVVVSEGVTRIGLRAFENCTNLESIELPSSLTTIGADAFNGCKSLANIIIPKSVKCITERTFAGCTNLSSVRILSDVFELQENPFENCTSLKALYVGANPGSIYAHYGWPFQSIYSTCTLYVPEGSKASYQNADWWCEFQNIKEYPEIAVSVSGSELRLDWGSRHQQTFSAVAFYPLSNETIKEAEWRTSGAIYATQIGDHGESLWPYAEVGPSYPGEGYVIVKTPDGKEGHSQTIKVYGDYEGTIQGDNFTFTNRVKYPDHYSIFGPYIITISGSGKLPDSEKDLYYVYNPYPLQRGVANTAFTYDTEVILDEGLTSIGTYYFCSWIKMNQITLPSTITCIGKGAFCYCSSLKSIEIPSNVEYIGDNAFEECTSLTSMYVTENIPVCETSEYTSPFTSIANTCTLYVPYGYKSAYQNAPGWSEFTNIVELDGPTDISQYEDVLYIKNAEAATGRPASLSIQLNNVKSLTGFQGDIVLPDGCSFVFDEYGFAEAELTEVRTNSKIMTFNTEIQEDGSLRLLAYSGKNIPFTGNEGEVATVTIEVDSKLEDREYLIQLKNIVLTEASGQTTKIENVKSTITVFSYTLGDANGDGEVNVGDLAATASYILGNPPANFVFKGADANEDNEINVGDLAKIAGIILGTSSSKAPQRAAETEASFDMNMMLEPMSDNSFLLHVGVDNMGVSFSGFQFDLNLPDGLNVKTDADGFAEVMLSTDRTNSRKTDLFDCSFMEDGQLRVLCASSHNALFEGESGEVATILLEADGSFDAQGTIALRNIVYTATGEGEKASDVELNIANAILSIEMLNNSTIVTVYNMNGSIVKRGLDAEQCLENLPHGIYVVDGKKVVR